MGLIKGGFLGLEGTIILHLMFADDTLIFSSIDLVEVRNLKRILKRFEILFRLKINFQKSLVNGVEWMRGFYQM